MFFHQTGSNNPIESNENIDKMSFHPFFTIKGIVGFQRPAFLTELFHVFS